MPGITRTTATPVLPPQVWTAQSRPAWPGAPSPRAPIADGAIKGRVRPGGPVALTVLG